jgi:aminoglycoside phosphotransferase (APT) family kinase protein
VLHAFAELHASFWDWSAKAREEILPLGRDTHRAARSREITRALDAAALVPAHRAAPEIVSPRLLETCRRAIHRWDRLLEAWSRGPLTLVHGDSHLGNCFEYPADSGPRVGMLDFQAVHWSHGVRDVQYFLINSLEPEILAAHEEALLRSYCDALGRHGVSLGLEEAWDRYRAFSFQTLMAGVVPLGLGALTERDQTVLAITRRSAAAAERLAFRDWLEALA